MGKTIVRKHLDNMNAQWVWEDFAAHMTTSSKGKAEKRRLHTYVTTTVLDKSWKGTTEQFILHFNEQFRQLGEVSPPEESLPFTTRLTLLQTAVHNIPELRMVETMEEFISVSSSTPGPPWAMTTTSPYSKMHALDMIATSNLSHLLLLELPINMNILLTSMTTLIPRITPPQAPPMVALTCQLKNSTRFTLLTSIGLLMSPPLPLGSPLLHLLLVVELPINMNFPMTSMTTLIPKTTPPQAPPMVALTCQLKNFTRFTLLTSIGLLLMSPPLPLGSQLLHLLLVGPLPGGLLAPSSFLPTFTNS